MTIGALTLHKLTKANGALCIPAILSLIKELALFEKAPESVEATEELLHQNLLGEGPRGAQYAECVLVYDGESPEEGGKAVAMALYFFTFSTWTGKAGLYLEDLFVKEEYRGQGIAKTLFSYLGQVANEKDCPRMDWVVIDWNEPAKEVYRKMGAVHKSEWLGMRLEGEALDKLASS